MNRMLNQLGLAVLVGLLAACASGAQKPPPSPPSGQPSGGGNRAPSGQQSPQTATQSTDQQLPVYVEGQIVAADTGQAMKEAVPVKLSCGVQTVQVIRTDIKGYFRFTLGAGTQSNMDFSAADDASPASMSTGLASSNGFGGFGVGGDSLTGCEVRVNVPGYKPLMLPITDRPSLGTIEIGTLELRRTTTVSSTTVSTTSLLVPNNARKEYEQGLKDLQGHRVPQATQHLERAVGFYDKYAAAWTDLGRAYAIANQPAKARESYEKAIAADDKYAPPYVTLATLQLEEQDYEGVLKNVGTAAELDPNILMGLGGYVQGLANFRLNRLDAAEQSLLQSEQGPHQSLTVVHAMLADLYSRKQDWGDAAAQMRAYLKEAPQGPYVDQLRQNLESIEKTQPDVADNKKTAP
jgi:tetratricopeptide (TPR) repeat protein